MKALCSTLAMSEVTELNDEDRRWLDEVEAVEEEAEAEVEAE